MPLAAIGMTQHETVHILIDMGAVRHFNDTIGIHLTKWRHTNVCSGKKPPDSSDYHVLYQLPLLQPDVRLHRVGDNARCDV